MATGRVPTTANSPLTAKGDLFGYSTTQARVAVGADGETIVADSSTSTGLRYQATTAAGKNAVINGGFDVWQRGTSGTSRGYNSADRWFCNNPGVGGRTFSRQASDLAGFQYFMRMQRTAANTLTDGFSITYNAETADSMRFAGQTVTLSWWMRKGANYSGGAVRGALYSGTGTDQNADNAYTGAVAVVNLTGTPTTSWVRYSVTGTVSSSATELAIAFVWDPTGTAGAADYLDVTGFQLEIGSVATQFTRAGGTIQGELAACQRYYQKSFDQATAPVNGTSANGQVYYNRQAASGSIEPTVWVKLSPTMRTAPSVALYNPYLASPGGQWSDGSISSANARTINLSDNGFTIDNTDVTYSTTNFAIQYSASAEL